MMHNTVFCFLSLISILVTLIIYLIIFGRSIKILSSSIFSISFVLLLMKHKQNLS